MAKKAKTESVLSRETRFKAEAAAIAAAKAAAEKAAAEAAQAAAEAAEKKRIAALPKPKVVRPKKVKKPRFVREQPEKKPEPKPKPAPLPERSTNLRGKMMTKNVPIIPKDEDGPGLLASGRPRP